LSLKEYSTIRGESTSLLVINKSKFIGLAVNVDNTHDANDILARIKKQHRDATHNCYAYIIGKNSEYMKYGDDGEPSGTAGIPMLEVLKKNNLTDILVISTRYFGGKKLGAGGLVRAYSSSVSETLTNSQIVNYAPCEIYSVKIQYDIWAKIEKKVLAANALIFKMDYLEAIYLEIGLKSEHKQEVFKIINQALKVDNAFEYIKTDFVELNN